MSNGFPSCVGSGYCCMKAPCPHATRKWGLDALLKAGRCPALTWDEAAGRYVCGEALADPRVAEMLYVGEGCSSSLNPWRRDVKPRPEVKYHYTE